MLEGLGWRGWVRVDTVEDCDTPGACSVKAANTAGGTTRFNVEPALQTMDQHYVNILHVLTILYRVCWAHAVSYTLMDPPTVPDHVTSYDHWACAQTSHALPCANAVGQRNAARSNLYRWIRKHQAIVKNVTEFLKASRHLLKRQGKKLKRHGAVTLGRFGGNPSVCI